jgi:glycolate oxidase iron-sulfur subunit
MAVHNMDLFLNRDLSAIVTDCAACGAELKVYHEIMAHGGKQATQAETFSAMVRDVNEFLAQELPADMRFGPIPEVACFHDPCHLRHAQGVVAPPRRLLRRIPELTLVDIPDNGQCCGSAGIYNVTHRERSMKILHAKVEAIRRTGASRVITSNPGCLMQLEVGDRLWNQPWHVSHIAEVLLRSLQIGENTNELGTPAVTAG